MKFIGTIANKLNCRSKVNDYKFISIIMVIRNGVKEIQRVINMETHWHSLILSERTAKGLSKH